MSSREPAETSWMSVRVGGGRSPPPTDSGTTAGGEDDSSLVVWKRTTASPSMPSSETTSPRESSACGSSGKSQSKSKPKAGPTRPSDSTHSDDHNPPETASRSASSSSAASLISSSSSASASTSAAAAAASGNPSSPEQRRKSFLPRSLKSPPRFRLGRTTSRRQHRRSRSGGHQLLAAAFSLADAVEHRPVSSENCIEFDEDGEALQSVRHPLSDADEEHEDLEETGRMHTALHSEETSASGDGDRYTEEDCLSDGNGEAEDPGSSLSSSSGKHVTLGDTPTAQRVRGSSGPASNSFPAGGSPKLYSSFSASSPVVFRSRARPQSRTVRSLTSSVDKKDRKKLSKLAKDPTKLVETYMAEKQDCIRDLTQQSSRFKVKRDRIALEIYSSEVTYVQSVQYLVEVVKPMAAKKKVFTKEQFSVLFQGLDSIRDVSMNLIESLEARITQWDENSTIGDLFVEASPWLNVYLQFCINTDAVNEILDTVSKKKSLQPWLHKVKALCGVPLPALLITPVQRIPRYRLLLCDLLKSTEPSHPDYEPLQKAVQLILALASKINKDVQDRQHVTALARLQDEVRDLDAVLKDRSISDFHVDSVLSVVREFRHTHPRELAETPPETFHRIFLLSDVLVSCRKEARVNPQYAVAHIYPLSSLFIDENVPPQMKQNSFRLLTPDWVLTLQTINSSSLEKQNLMTHILSSIRRQRDKQGLLSKEGVPVFGYEFANGNSYKGEWGSNGFPHGHGELRYDTGFIYTGELRNGQQVGQGKLIYDGNIYDGGWLNNKPHGEGCLSFAGDRGRYRGAFFSGKRHGVGEMIWGPLASAGAEKDVAAAMLRFSVQRSDPSKCTLNGSASFPTAASSSVTVSAASAAQGRVNTSATATTTTTTARRGGEVASCEAASHEMEKPAKKVYKVEVPSPRLVEYYCGEWKMGRVNGKGVYLFRDGSRYQGEWMDGKRHGRGLYHAPDGSVYDGEWKLGLEEGPGEMRFPNGSSYVGSWKSGRRHGEGCFEAADASWRYQGGWESDRRHGHGHLVHKDGTKYLGEWRNDFYHGHGVLRYPDGSSYDGSWENGTPHGEGVKVTLESRFEGQWDHGLRSGKGTEIKLNGCIYEGDWLNDRRHGTGRQELPNKDYYDGEWYEDFKHGQGKFLKDGGEVIYEGEWKFNLRHGNGKLTTSEGVYDGPWESDLKHGNGVFVRNDGVRFVGKWKNDRKTGIFEVYTQEAPERPSSPKGDSSSSSSSSSKESKDKHQPKPERWMYVDDIKEVVAVPLQPLIPPRAFVW
mmetsp:Transcript_6090/g.18561  ORF Transcript_6090/g.18561 Transcript_6090/m.18561 type:complete len:1275 (-) Transcript_6090:92-3916(-)